jgi:hypothetical protein
MPTGLIEDDQGVGAGGNLGGDLVEIKLHGLAVAEGKNQRGAGSKFRAPVTELVGD